MRRQIDDALRDKLTVSDHDHYVGARAAQLFDNLRPANPFRLLHRTTQTQRGLFYGRGTNLLTTAFWPVRLCVYSQHFMAGVHEPLEARHREFRRTHKNDLQTLRPG